MATLEAHADQSGIPSWVPYQLRQPSPGSRAGERRRAKPALDRTLAALEARWAALSDTLDGAPF